VFQLKESKVSTQRPVKSFHNNRNQEVWVPHEFELEGDVAIMHREEDCLIIEPMRMRGLLATLAKLPTLEDDIPDVDLCLLPLDSHEEQCKLRIILRIFINESLQAILNRTEESLLYELFQGVQIDSLTGSRQSGKTTLARKVMW